MADETLYTYEGGLVLDRTTFEPSVGTPGAFTTTTGTPAQTYDLNGLAQPVVTGSHGYYSGFKAPHPVGLLDFGDVPLVVVSVEARNGAAQAQIAAAAAADAAARAATAVTAAQDAAADASEARAAAELAASTAQGATDASVAAILDDPDSATRDRVVDIIGTTPGVGGVTYATAAPDSHYIVVQAADGTWPGGSTTTWVRGRRWEDLEQTTSRADLHFTLVGSGNRPTGLLAGSDFYERIA